MNNNGKKKKKQAIPTNIFEQQELIVKTETIRANLKALTGASWRLRVSSQRMISSHL